MAINSISHLSSLPHYWVVEGLSWWVLPCCCEAGLLEEGASKEQRRSAAEEAATACSDVRSTAEQQQGSTHSVRGTEGEGSLEMSELWLPRWHCPFLILAEGRPEAQSGFLDLGLWLAYGYK